MTVTVSATRLRAFTENLLARLELENCDAACVADALVQADLRGVHSHGLANLPRYARGYMRGHLNPRPCVKVVRQHGGTAVLDGDNGLGMVTCTKGMELALELAETYGVGVVGVRNSNHFGAAAYYAMKAIPKECIGYATTNGHPVMAPWGGTKALLSNNPFCFAVPTNEHPPVVLDMSTGVAARGWIRLAAAEGRAIPPGWAIDKQGEPTTDPRAALDGTVLPVGGHKGYGLALVSEILAAALPGALFAYEISNAMVGADSELGDFVQLSWGCGHLVAALSVGAFGEVESFKKRVDELCWAMKGSPTGKATEHILIPGEREFALSTQRYVSGIPLPEAVVDDLNALAEELGVERV